MLLRISHMRVKTLLLVAAFYTPNLVLWESHLQNFVSVSNFSAHLYPINHSPWEKPNSEHKGKTYCSSGHVMGYKCYVDSP